MIYVQPLKLSGKKIKCVEQTITNFAYECPSTITCSNSDYAVCSGGENEIQCKLLPKYNFGVPYICNDNTCSKSFKDWGKDVVCGDLYLFYEYYS